MLRKPVARGFYPGNLERAMSELLKDAHPAESLPVVGAGIVPHAGWMFSGAVAARVLASLCHPVPPRCFLLLGAVHQWGVSLPSLYPEGRWETPLGEVFVDEIRATSLRNALGELLVAAPEAHAGEHSIEVLLPMIAYLAPEARILPIAVPPSDKSTALGAAIARWVEEEGGDDLVVVASSDLTHYGERYGFAPAGEGPEAASWMKDNDRRIIDLALRLDGEAIVAEARAHHNACGSGAMAAVVAYARARGATKGTLLSYTTSHDVLPDPTFSMAVGYAGILF